LDLRFAGRLISSRSGHHHWFPTVFNTAEMAGLGSLDDVVVVNSSHNLSSLGTRPVYKYSVRVRVHILYGPVGTSAHHHQSPRWISPCFHPPVSSRTTLTRSIILYPSSHRPSPGNALFRQATPSDTLEQSTTSPHHHTMGPAHSLNCPMNWFWRCSSIWIGNSSYPSNGSVYDSTP
jgi:hypothetical protein